MKLETACRKLVAEFNARPTLRSGSLITTVFGDAIAPRGGSVWLGSLISLMADFGISERLVRTSAYRLACDGWLRSDKIGRRSYYSLSKEGRLRFCSLRLWRHRTMVRRTGPGRPVKKHELGRNCGRHPACWV